MSALLEVQGLSARYGDSAVLHEVSFHVEEGELFGIPVSGKPVDGLLDAQLTGSPLLTGNGFGLEASPIAMAIGTLCAVVLILGAARANRIITPAWLRDRP